MFQLTTSRRGRQFHPMPEYRIKRVSTHDLTKRSTAFGRNRSIAGTCFNSRPHEEVDCHPYPSACPCSCFNSRPHEEVDNQAAGYFVVTEGFQLTTSRRGRLFVSSITCPTFLFQLTTSRRGRQQFLRKKFSFQNHFLCLLHIIYSYYIYTIFFSTLFLAKSSFFLVRIL